MRRQPVILTEEEKRRIDEEHPGSYSQVIKYGSDPKKPYYYICPRYWSIPEIRVYQKKKYWLDNKHH
jgi:hypothetical protein